MYTYGIIYDVKLFLLIHLVGMVKLFFFFVLLILFSIPLEYETLSISCKAGNNYPLNDIKPGN